MSLHAVASQLKESGVGFRVVTAAGSGSDAAKKFAADITGRRASVGAEYLPRNHARISIGRGLVVTAPKFDGKSGAYKRFGDALEAAIQPFLNHDREFPGWKVVVDNYKNYNKQTEIRIRVYDASSKVVDTVTLDPKDVSPLDADRLQRQGQALVKDAQESNEKIRKSNGNKAAAIEAAEKLHAALHECASALGVSPSQVVEDMRGLIF